MQVHEAAKSALPGFEEHRLLCEAVREAGELALKMFRAGVDAWDKRDGTPVSEADLAVDRLLAARLLEGLPGSGWLSEEALPEANALASRRSLRPERCAASAMIS